ncbi:MAG: hypothetical protein CMD74_02560 [Gammaproteobacteria bacterium]|nr:hypothetical protein [Gammaproteobacteria bacterium]
MDPDFPTFAASRPYTAFKQEITRIGLFLPKETVNHFSALSRYFNNLLNHLKSDFGRRFWKTLAVKNDGIRAFKSKRINFKFKQMMKLFGEIKKKVKVHKVPMWRSYSICQNCGKRYQTDFNLWFFDDQYNRYCNCEFVNGESRIEIIKRDIETNKQGIIDKKRVLVLQMRKLDERLEDLFEKEKNVNSIRHLEKMKPAFQNMKQNGHYKATRKQAASALKELEKYDSWTSRVRRNVNYKPPIGAALVGGR